MILCSHSRSCVSWTVPVTRGFPSFAPWAAGLLAEGSPGCLHTPGGGHWIVYFGVRQGVSGPGLQAVSFYSVAAGESFFQ